MKHIKQILILLLIIFPLFCYSQVVKNERLLSFEESEVPGFITGVQSELSISGEHYKDGHNSLLWKFKPKGEVNIKKDLKFEPKDPAGADTYLSTFIVWIYNEKAIDDVVNFEFYKDGKKCTSFPFKIDFTGWRGAWVCYERDMEGTPEEGMNEIRIVAPDVEGKLYIDHLLPAAKTDHRYQTADMQVPFVNKDTESHWLVILKRWQMKPDIQLESVISGEQKNDLRKIENRFREMIYIPYELTKKELESIQSAYQYYDIKYVDGKITGLPVFYTRAAEAYERIMPGWRADFFSQKKMEVSAYFNLMNRIAVAYNNAMEEKDKEVLKLLFLNMYNHITDQGFVFGSCMGNITHYGYSFRTLYTSYFLMKDVLADAGKLDEAEKTMLWYATTNEVYLHPEKQGMDMDAFNTVTMGRMASILIMDDSPEKVRYMKSFSRWIDNGCLPAVGLMGAFKIDGGAFHHCNNYPAYAVGGLSGATDMIYLLSNTGFSVSKLAHQTVKNVLLTMRFYCNQNSFPLSMSVGIPTEEDS